MLGLELSTQPLIQSHVCSTHFFFLPHIMFAQTLPSPGLVNVILLWLSHYPEYYSYVPRKCSLALSPRCVVPGTCLLPSSWRWVATESGCLTYTQHVLVWYCWPGCPLFWLPVSCFLQPQMLIGLLLVSWSM